MFATLFHDAVLQAIPLLFGCVGEIITEKSGNLNLGIPGIIYVGGIAGTSGAFLYENYLESSGAAANPFLVIFIPLMCCLAGSLLMGLIYSFLTITLRANQNVTGLALTTFGLGIGNFFGGSLNKLVDSDVSGVSVPFSSRYFSQTPPFAKNLGWFGEMFLNYSFLVFVALVVAIAASLFLKKTRAGLNLRAVGENPATADAAGINVTRYKYLATCIGSMIAGLGGLFYIMDYVSGSWSNNGMGDRGWLAIALVIFIVWKPNFAIFGSILFGGLYIIAYKNIIPVPDAGGEKELIKMIPYVVTVVVLILNSMRKKRETQPPEALGLAYFREDR